MSIPENLKYSKTNEWLSAAGESSAKIGLTDFAQKRMGGIVFVDLPNVGDTVAAGQSFGDVESTKAAFELISPVSGIVEAINEEVLNEPEKINSAPYESWLIEVSGITSQIEMMDADVYGSACMGDE